MDETPPGPAIPAVDGASVGWLTADEMAEVDRVMIEELHIELVQMMENAGRSLARLALTLLEPERATILAGKGGNGGGGLVAARHLANLGVEVTVVLSHAADALDPVARHQLDIVGRLPITLAEVVPAESDLVIDALVGYGLRGAPRGRTGELVAAAVDGRWPILALDNPSGLDATTGATPGVVAPAVATMTLALPKRGLAGADAVGELYLADISVPPAVYGSLGVAAPDFRPGPILHLVGSPPAR